MSKGLQTEDLAEAVALDPRADAKAPSLANASGYSSSTETRRVSESTLAHAIDTGQAADLVWFTVAFALLTGLMESGYWFFKRELCGELIHLSESVYWMTPVAQLATLSIPGLLLALASGWHGRLARRCSRSAMLTFCVTLVSFVGWLDVVFLFPKIHFLASLVLTAGLAAGTGRMYDRFGKRSRRVVRLSAPLLAIFVIALAGFSEASGPRNRNMTTACHAHASVGMPPQPPVAAPAGHRGRPNVLLIVLDTVRADVLGMYGASPSRSPELDRWAARGVVFDSAYATAPWTLPSHAGFFTSRLPHDLSGDWSTPLDEQHATLAEWLAGHGYLAVGFVANTRYASAETGLARGFEHYEDFGYTAADFALSTALGRRLLLGNVPTRLGFVDWPGRKPAAEINASFLDWLSRRDDRPFFAFLNYWDAHDPYVPQPPFDEHFSPTYEQQAMLKNWWWIDKQRLTDEQVAFARSAYDDCIRSLDHHVGRLLDSLESKGILDDTLVIITADHGEQFGEHGLFSRGNSLYEPVLHVPLLVVHAGGVPAGRRVAEAVSLRDLPATICEIVGGMGGLSALDSPFWGNSWSRLWHGDESGASNEGSPVIAEIATPAKFPPDHGRSPVAGGSLATVIDVGMKYIRSTNGTEELYDLADYPEERQNLVGDEDRRPTVDRLRKLLEDNALKGAPSNN